MIGTDVDFAVYESAITMDGFIPDTGIRLVCGYTADGARAFFAEIDALSAPDKEALTSALRVMAHVMTKEAKLK